MKENLVLQFIEMTHKNITFCRRISGKISWRVQTLRISNEGEKNTVNKWSIRQKMDEKLFFVLFFKRAIVTIEHLKL